MNEVDSRTEQDAPLNPTVPIPVWAQQFRRNWKSKGTKNVTYFGTMGDLTRENRMASKKSKVDGALVRLCSAVSATADQEDLLLAGFKFLQKASRNRDTHAYVPNTRDAQFSTVPELSRHMKLFDDLLDARTRLKIFKNCSYGHSGTPKYPRTAASVWHAFYGGAL